MSEYIAASFEEESQWEEFRKEVAEHFASVTKGKKMLFQVSTVGLWDIFIGSFPEEKRQTYNCRTCRHFIERFGGIVVLHEDGSCKSALWYPVKTPMFMDVAKNMSIFVQHRAVKGVFISDCAVLGVPETDGWTHLYAKLANQQVNTSSVETASQKIARYAEDRRALMNALREFSDDTANKAVSLLSTETIYRAAEFIPQAKWFATIKSKLAQAKSNSQKQNMIWYAVGNAPSGFCHVKSSMLGSLMDDIQSGMSTRVISARWEEKMNPANYMRSQSAPTASAIYQAEQTVEKLGIADSLRRRYARFAEVEDRCVWKPVVVPSTKQNDGVFSHLAAKAKDTVPTKPMNLPTSTMTWVKFQRTVLPNVQEMELLVDQPSRFMAMVTESIEDSEPILNWNNPFSWYYHAGVDGEMKQRVERAGGTYEDCEIRCTLMWNNRTDLDIHCVTPRGSHIYYREKQDRWSSGYLDVDMNVRGETTEPVENIRWRRNAPEGHYRFYVHNYYDRNHYDNPYVVELQVAGQTYICEGCLAHGQTDVFVFDYRDGKISNLQIGGQKGSVQSSSAWGIATNSFAKVKGILRSPNAWDCSSSVAGEHWFFLLDGCKDADEGKGRGFFNEMLKPELRTIRKTLELYTAETPLEGAEEADACGIGYAIGSDWNVTLKVTENGNTRLVKIDRYD